MRITVTRTGGFGGLRVERSVDTSGRPDAAEWEELVRTAGLDSVPASPPQPDRFGYVIDVDGRRVTVGEPDLTGPLHTLVQRVLSSDR
ncbi:MAG TPA: protealysin inhibitor emfourin [Mycobacteriales bacterium]|jgi:hypothetical protein|nr:protealysin inhibitor emfourin [Mycobacteriales bacterium]